MQNGSKKKFSFSNIKRPYGSFRMFWTFVIAEMAFNFIWPYESFISIWLKQYAGVNTTGIGFMFSMTAFVGMIGNLFVGFAADKLVLKRHLVFILAILLILIGPFLLWVITPMSHAGTAVLIVASALGVYLGLAGNVGSTVQEQYLRRASYVNRFDYGWARSGTSFISIVGPLVCGALLAHWPTYFVFVMTVVGFVFFAVSVGYRFDTSNLSVLKDDTSKSSKQQKVSMKEIIKTMLSKPFICFVVYSMTAAPANNIVSQQIGVYFNTLFTDPNKGTAIFTIISSVMGILGFISMLVLPPFIKKLSPRQGLLWYAALNCGYLFILALVPNWIGASVAYVVFAGISGSFWWICQTTYVFNIFKKNEYSTIQSLSTGVMYQIGMLVLSALAGVWYSKLGFPHTYLILGFICIFSFVWGFFTLEKTDSEEKLEKRATVQKE